MDIIRRAVLRYGLAALLSTVPSLALSLLTISEVKIESGVILHHHLPYTYRWHTSCQVSAQQYYVSRGRRDASL